MMLTSHRATSTVPAPTAHANLRHSKTHLGCRRYPPKQSVAVGSFVLVRKTLKNTTRCHHAVQTLPVAVNLLFLLIRGMGFTKGSQGKESGWFVKFHLRQLGFWSPASPPFELTQK